MTNRGSNRPIAPRRTPSFRGSALALSLVLGGLSLPTQAQFATGGSGRFKEEIFWFDWGTQNGTIPSGGTTVTNTFTAPSGQQLRMTCSISNLVGSMFIKQPGDYHGDGLDDLYNIGGTGASNTMDIGLVNTTQAATVTFTFACSATLGAVGDSNPPAYPLSGLVFADSEHSHNVAPSPTNPGTIEYTEGTITSVGTTWRMIDRFRNCTTTDTPVIRSSTATQSTLRMGATTSVCATGPMGVAFLEGTNTADVVLKGGGQSAIALGAVVVTTTDYGDAPLSYGEPTHTAQASWAGGVPADNATTQLHSMTLADLVQPTARLGSLVDAELGSTHNANADGDDTIDSDDEDGFTAPLGVVVAVPGETYTPPSIACSGGGVVRGWVDFNDAGEISNNAPVCPGGANGSGTVSLNWTVPASASMGRSYMRLRTASVASQIASADSPAADGEVEDYLITALAPAKVTLVKRIDSRLDAADQFTVSVLDGASVVGSATTAGAALTADTGELPVDVTGAYTLRDANAGGTAMLRYNASLACVADTGSTGAVPTPTGPTGTGPVDWNITFNNGNDLTCTITNTPNRVDLAIAKTNGRASSVRGETSQYTLTVTNNGPGTAINPVVTDPAVPGLDCPVANAVTCTGVAGACPAAAVTVGDLQAGTALGTIPATAGSNTVTLTFSCTVL